MLKRILLLIFIFAQQSTHSMNMSYNVVDLVNLTANQTLIANKVIFNNKLEFIKPVKTVSNKIFNSCKTALGTTMTSLCQAFNNPYVLLIKGEALALTYIFCVNSCPHNTNLTNLFSPENVCKFISTCAPSIAEGVVYAIGEKAYEKSNTLTKKTTTASSVAIIGLDFVCQSCFNKEIPTTAKKLIVTSATIGSLDLIQKKADQNKKTLTKVLKNPIVIGSAVVAGALACTYIYKSFDSENIPALVPAMVTMLEQSVFYTYAYRFTKNLIVKIKKK